MSYYLVAYGHVIRCEKAPTATKAAVAAFGIDHPERITCALIAGLPKNMKQSILQTAQAKLAVKHFRKTGSIVSGYEKEPGILNVNWCQCCLCKKSILTEPANEGNNETCIECLEKVGNPFERSESISQLREQYKIAVIQKIYE